MLVVTDKMKREYKEETGIDWGDKEERAFEVIDSFLNPVPKDDLLTMMKQKSNQLKKLAESKKDIKEDKKSILFLRWVYNDKMDTLIIRQQNIFNELRAIKCSNGMIKKAVKILMKLKSEFKEQNGREWEPPVYEN